MANATENRWKNWFVWSRVFHEQVKQTVSLSEESDPYKEAIRKGKNGLAIVSTAFFLEAYANAFTDFHVLEHLRDVFSELSVPKRIRLFPRFSGNTQEISSIWENKPIHKEISGLFTLRNQIAHVKLDKLNTQNNTSNLVKKHWNMALDLIFELETDFLFRIPKSSHSDFKKEIDALRI